MQSVTKGELSFDELLASPGVVEAVQLGTRFGFMAFHGGNLERRTERVAELAAELSGASVYTVTQPEGMRQHVPSAEIGANPSPALKEFLGHCDVVVALHGYGRWGRWTDLLFGGQHRELAAHTAGHVHDQIPFYRPIVDLDEIPAGLRGLHQDNPCNLTRGGGIQLELPPRVRGMTPMARHWPQPHPRPAVFPHLRSLAEGLAKAASTWPETS